MRGKSERPETLVEFLGHRNVDGPALGGTVALENSFASLRDGRRFVIAYTPVLCLHFRLWDGMDK